MSNLDKLPTIEIPIGASSVTYDFVAETAEQLGREIDEFIGNIDFDFTEIETSFNVSFDASHIYMALGVGVVRSSIGPFAASLTLTRRESF